MELSKVQRYIWWSFLFWILVLLTQPFRPSTQWLGMCWRRAYLFNLFFFFFLPVTLMGPRAFCCWRVSYVYFLFFMSCGRSRARFLARADTKIFAVVGDLMTMSVSSMPIKSWFIHLNMQNTAENNITAFPYNASIQCSWILIDKFERWCYTSFRIGG